MGPSRGGRGWVGSEAESEGGVGARGAIEHLAQRVGSRTVQGDQTRVRSVMASAGPTQEGSKALLQFGADLVGGAVGTDLLDPVGEEVDPLRLAQGDQGRDPG